MYFLNTSYQTSAFSHPLSTLFGIFTTAAAQDETAEKQVIKELKVKIYDLDGEPVKEKNLLQSDKKYILDLKEQLNDLIKIKEQKEKEIAEKKKKDEKEDKRQAIKSEIENEIISLGFEPVTKRKEKEFANDEEILALKKQLDEIKKLKAKDEKEAVEKKKKMKKKTKTRT